MTDSTPPPPPPKTIAKLSGAYQPSDPTQEEFAYLVVYCETEARRFVLSESMTKKLYTDLQRVMARANPTLTVV